MFGDYEDDGEVRELEPTWGTLPKKLLVNVVQACRERRSELKIDLKIAIDHDLDIDELAANGGRHPSNSAVPYFWRFRFDDLPELNIEYRPFYRPLPPFDGDWEDAEFHCWGTIRRAAEGL